MKWTCAMLAACCLHPGEYPSQVNEIWRDWPEVLRNYAKHYKTGEAMPAELLRRVMAAESIRGI